jgi:2-(1,2-epoxy-1,2-dihydrophenyl)acetyl-CoA isomerase
MCNNMSDSVKLQIGDGIATITLDDPDRLNTISPEIRDGILTALDEVRETDARCVVFTGANGAFSAGGDIDEMLENIEEGGIQADRAIMKNNEFEPVNDIVRTVLKYPLPTVAKIDGPAVGAGGCLALACDVQLASNHAKIGFVFRQVGLGLDYGASYLLPRVVGLNVAKELAFTGKILDADRAHELGLFNHVYSSEVFEEEVDEFVEELAQGPTVALAQAKRALNKAWELDLEAALENEAATQGLVFESEDHAEGVQAFLEDRDPNFSGT